MSSYISTISITSSVRQSLLQMQQQLSNDEIEVSTGDYADVGLSLGNDSGNDVSLQQQSARLQTVTDTNSVVASRLGTTQTVLQNFQTSAQDTLNALIENNGFTSNASTVQSNAANSLESLISGLNTTLSGSYIFAGTNTANQPVTAYTAGSTNAQAVDSAFSTAFGMSQTSADVSTISGTDMTNFLNNQFDGLFTGSNWSSSWSSASDTVQTTQISGTQNEGTSVSANETAFKQLTEAYTMLSNLGTQNLGSDAYKAVTDKATTLLTSALTGLTNIQANVGSVQSDVTNANNQMSLQMNILSTQISNLESVNTYEASAQITTLQTQIETAYSLTAQINKLSLVNYL